MNNLKEQIANVIIALVFVGLIALGIYGVKYNETRGGGYKDAERPCVKRLQDPGY